MTGTYKFQIFHSWKSNAILPWVPKFQKTYRMVKLILISVRFLVLCKVLPFPDRPLVIGWSRINFAFALYISDEYGLSKLHATFQVRIHQKIMIFQTLTHFLGYWKISKRADTFSWECKSSPKAFFIYFLFDNFQKAPFLSIGPAISGAVASFFSWIINNKELYTNFG